MCIFTEVDLTRDIAVQDTRSQFAPLNQVVNSWVFLHRHIIRTKKNLYGYDSEVRQITKKKKEMLQFAAAVHSLQIWP